MKTQFVNLVSRTNVLRMATMFAVLIFASSCSEKEEMPVMPINTETKNISYLLDNFQASYIAGMNEDDFLKKGVKVPKFNTLNAALGKTQLSSVLAKEELTVFAPTDEAFEALGLFPGNINDVPNLKEILLYHVLAGKVYSNMLSNKFVPTVNGSAMQINIDNE